MIPTAHKLLQRGGLRLRCNESIDKVKCGECGNTSHSAAEWAGNGGACPICNSASMTYCCVRCDGVFHEPGLGGEHPCRSVDEFRRTGRIAFAEALSSKGPQRIKEPESPRGDRKADRPPKSAAGAHGPKPHPHPVPASPPRSLPGVDLGLLSDYWSRAVAVARLALVRAFEDWLRLVAAARIALVAALLFGAMRILFDWWFDAHGSFISASSARSAPASTFIATALFFACLLFSWPFKMPTAVAVVVAVATEFFAGIAGQSLANFDWFVSSVTRHASLPWHVISWASFGFVSTFALRCGESAYDYKRWILLGCIIAFSVVWFSLQILASGVPRVSPVAAHPELPSLRDLQAPAENTALAN